MPPHLKERVERFGFELPNCDIAVMPWLKPFVLGEVEDVPWDSRPDNGEFFNHSCDPNAWWEDDYRLVARRDIAENEQICYDYCTEDMDVVSFNCECGAGLCRKRVLKEDWMSTVLWERYNTHWKSHILEAITLLKSKQQQLSTPERSIKIGVTQLASPVAAAFGNVNGVDLSLYDLERDRSRSITTATATSGEDVSHSGHSSDRDEIESVASLSSSE